MTTAQEFIAWWPITDDGRRMSELIAEATDSDDNDLISVAVDAGVIPVGERTWRIGQGEHGPILACLTYAIPLTTTQEHAA